MHDRRLLWHLDNRWRDVEAVGKLIVEYTLAAGDGASSGLGSFERIFHGDIGALVDEGTNERSFRGRVADGKTAVGGSNASDYVVVETRMHDQATKAGAPLASGSYSREHDRADSKIEIGARRHDQCVVAAKFENGSPKSRGDIACNFATHSC